VLKLVEIAVAKGLQDYEVTNGKSVEEEVESDERLKGFDKKKGGTAEDVPGVNGEVNGDGVYETSIEMVKACKRPWWVCQAYVRPLPAEALAKGSLTLSKKELAKLEKTKGHGNEVKIKEELVGNGRRK